MVENKSTLIISGFPGVGKSYFKKKSKFAVWDSDSSRFSWIEDGVRDPNFPNNYIKHILGGIGLTDIILVSSHKVVRDELVKNGISFTLVYPKRSIKEEYIGRYKTRGSNEKFVKLLDENWDNFITEMEDQDDCSKYELSEGEYLNDFLGGYTNG